MRGTRIPELSNNNWTSVVVQTYDPSTEEAKSGGGEFEISLAIQLKFCLTGDKKKR